MKGADVVMSSIVQYNDWLDEEVSMKKYFCNMLYFYFIFMFFVYIRQNDNLCKNWFLDFSFVEYYFHGI